MSRVRYKTNADRMMPLPAPVIWERAECYLIQHALNDKGYSNVLVNGYRVDQNAVERNNLVVSRNPESLKNIMELLLRLRVDVEVHVESSYEVGLLILGNLSADKLLNAVKRMPECGGSYY